MYSGWVPTTSLLFDKRETRSFNDQDASSLSPHFIYLHRTQFFCQKKRGPNEDPNEEKRGEMLGPAHPPLAPYSFRRTPYPLLSLAPFTKGTSTALYRVNHSRL